MSIEHLTRSIEESKGIVERVIQCRETFNRTMCNNRSSTQMLIANINADLKVLSSTIFTHPLNQQDIQRSAEQKGDRKRDEYSKMFMTDKYLNDTDDWANAAAQIGGAYQRHHPSTNLEASAKMDDIPDSQISQLDSNSVSENFERSKSAMSERVSKLSTSEVRGSDIDMKEFEDMNRTSVIHADPVSSKTEDGGQMRRKTTFVGNELTKGYSDVSFGNEPISTDKESHLDVDSKFSRNLSPESRQSRMSKAQSMRAAPIVSMDDPQLRYVYQSKKNVSVIPQHIRPSENVYQNPFAGYCLDRSQYKGHTGVSMRFVEPSPSMRRTTGVPLLIPPDSRNLSFVSDCSTARFDDEQLQFPSFQVKRSYAPTSAPPVYTVMDNKYFYQDRRQTMNDPLFRPTQGPHTLVPNFSNPANQAKVPDFSRQSMQPSAQPSQRPSSPVLFVPVAPPSPKPQQVLLENHSNKCDLGDLMKCMQSVYSELNRIEEAYAQTELGSPRSHPSDSRALSPLSPKKRRHHRVIKTTAKELT